MNQVKATSIELHAEHAEHSERTALGQSPAYRRILWITLVINAIMFFVEVYFSQRSGSVSLLADAIDFFGDASSIALSLWVLGSVLAARSKLAFCKGAIMFSFGIFILIKAGLAAYYGSTPEPLTMGVIGVMALIANLGMALLLYAYREGDANMRSVWVCTRNDALGNLAILCAALGVFGTATRWPDLIVALFMGCLAVSGGVQVMLRASEELKTGEVRLDTHGHSHDHAH